MIILPRTYATVPEIVNILVKYYDRSACSDAYLGKNY